jgi:hypothetical protein
MHERSVVVMVYAPDSTSTGSPNDAPYRCGPKSRSTSLSASAANCGGIRARGIILNGASCGTIGSGIGVGAAVGEGAGVGDGAAWIATGSWTDADE